MLQEIRNSKSTEQARRDALIAKRIATVSFNNTEKPPKFETESFASLSVSERKQNQLSASRSVVSSFFLCVLDVKGFYDFHMLLSGM